MCIVRAQITHNIMNMVKVQLFYCNWFCSTHFFLLVYHVMSCGFTVCWSYYLKPVELASFRLLESID